RRRFLIGGAGAVGAAGIAWAAAEVLGRVTVAHAAGTAFFSTTTCGPYTAPAFPAGRDMDYQISGGGGGGGTSVLTTYGGTGGAGTLLTGTIDGSSYAGHGVSGFVGCGGAGG